MHAKFHFPIQAVISNYGVGLCIFCVSGNSLFFHAFKCSNHLIHFLLMLMLQPVHYKYIVWWIWSIFIVHCVIHCCGTQSCFYNHTDDVQLHVKLLICKLLFAANIYFVGEPHLQLAMLGTSLIVKHHWSIFL